MASPEDLLCRSFREPLSRLEEARLQRALSSSTELALASVVGKSLAREGLAQAEDAAAHQALAEHVLERLAAERVRAPARPRRRRRGRWFVFFGVPLLAAGAAAAAAGGYQWVVRRPGRTEQPVAGAKSEAARPVLARAAGPAPELGQVAAAATRQRPLPSVAVEPTPAGPTAAGPTAAEPVAAAPALADGAAPAEAVVSASAPSRSEATARGGSRRRRPRNAARRRSRRLAAGSKHPKPAAAPAGSPRRTSMWAATPPEVFERLMGSSRPSEPSGQPAKTSGAGSPRARPAPGARELLQRAQRARARSWRLAAPLYQQLIYKFPVTEEAGVAELVLAKRALARGNSAEALAWFRRYQRRADSPLLPEAHWGEAQALLALERPAELRRALQFVARSFPETPYGASARRRLLELPP